MAHIFAVINQKGGTAKTTTAVALASKLALLGHRVLLVDLDPQANTTISFGIDSTALEKSTYDVLVRGAALDEVIVSTGIEKLHLAPGQVELSKTDINLADAEEKQFRLKNALQKVEERYEFVFVDCPPSFGLIPVNALVAATGVIVPMVPQYFSLEGLKQVTTSIDSIKKELNPNLDITGILFCIVDMRLKITEPAIQIVRRHYGEKVFNTFIHVCSKINEANMMGQSLFEYAPKSRAALEYSALVEEILKKVNQSALPSRFSLSDFKNVLNF